MPLQCGTQWDALGHIFYDDKMWNGYDAKLVDSGGAQKNGIEKTKAKMVGRNTGVLVKRDGKWKWKVMAEAGWGGMSANGAQGKAEEKN